MISSAPAIEMRNVTRMFGMLCAVNNVSFTVGRGEIVGFIGPNGAGKTTSMRILATLDLPTRGDALIDGFSIVNDPDRVRRQLGFMPDNYGTYPHMNCEEYLDFFARAYGLVGKERIAALRRVIEFAQLGPLAQKSIRGLSKGMKQRLCLGRALIHDPQVIVLDEPAAGLDPRARIELRTMISALADQGKSILISSHILSELAEVCHRVVIIEAGRLVAVGSVDEIMSATQKNQSPDALVDVSIRINDDPLPLVEWLNQHQLAKDAQIVVGEVRFKLPANPECHEQMIRELVAANFKISSFAPKQQSLEDVFVEVTKGIVQ